MEKLTQEQRHEAAAAKSRANDLAGELAVIRWSERMEVWEVELHLEWAWAALDALVASMASLPRPEPKPVPDDAQSDV
jgi:hypothetical protein